MIDQTLHRDGLWGFTMDRLRSYGELLKPRLSFLVAFSSIFGFVLGSEGAINWIPLLMLGLGGFLISGGVSNHKSNFGEGPGSTNDPNPGTTIAG